jgi:membrane-bound ClpP family serine protease
MLGATRDAGTVRRARVALAALALLALLAPAARADDVEGRFITVGNPITSEVTSRVKEATARAVQQFKSGGNPGGRRVLKIVYDFNPDGRPAGTRDFGPCHDLASFLLEQQEVHTVAFVHGETTRHTVLPVLACRDVVLSSSARLGDVGRDGDPQRLLADPVVMAAYHKVVKDRRCPAVALKMIDPDMEVVRAKKLKGSGDWYIDKRQEGEEKKNGVIVLDPNPAIAAGPQTTLYTQEQAEKLGLAVLRKENRQEVAEAYGLPPTSLREDPLQGRSPVAFRIVVRGAVTDALAETVKRQVGHAIGQQANLIFLHLECGGGDTLAARDLAEFLRTRKDDRGEHPVMTVAYVPRAAPDTAVFLAMGCTEVVLHRDATLGDFSGVITERRGGDVTDVPPERYKLKRESLEDLARKQGYPVLLARGMMDREVAVFQVRHKKTGEWAFLTGEDLQADRAAAEPQWGNEQLVKDGGPKGKALVLNAEEARRWGLARHSVENEGELCALYGVPPEQVKEAGPDWLDDLAEFLRRPLTRIFLVMIGIICLVLELKMPGIGVPGVIAAVCFILFFWSHSQSAGLDLLALLLFILGLVLIGLEVFVLPGFGVCGVSGTLLIVFSLALVALEKRPQTSDEWVGLLTLMGQFGLGLLAAVVAAVMLASYLPSIPYLNRLVLRPQGEAADGGAEEPSDAVRPETAALLGAIGVAATPLRPAGKVKFGEEYIDVVAEGAYVPPGTRVQVVEIEGNRIVVKEVV